MSPPASAFFTFTMQLVLYKSNGWFLRVTNLSYQAIGMHKKNTLHLGMSSQTDISLPQQVMPQEPLAVDMNAAASLDLAAIARNEAEAQANLTLAQGLFQQIDGLAKSNPERARALLNQLLAIPIIAGTSVTVAMANLVLQGMGDEKGIKEAEQAEQRPPVDIEIFKEPERGILVRIPKELRDAIKSEFSQDLYKGMNGESITGEDARKSATNVAAATIRGKGDEATIAKVEDIQLLHSIRAAQIIEGPDSEGDKAAKLERLQKAATRAATQLTQVQQAEQAERNLPADKHALKPSMLRNRELCREALAQELETGILKETVTDPAKEHAQMRGHNQDHGTLHATKEERAEKVPQGVSVTQHSAPMQTPRGRNGGVQLSV